MATKDCSVGAVIRCLFSAANGCEGPQPSRSPPIIVATNGWAMAGRSPGGRPLCRRRETGVQFTAANGCEGPQPSRPPPIIVATNGWAMAGRFPGGRPLRRRRETGVQFTAANGCEGPQPSRPPIIVATNGWAMAGRFPGGHPLCRRRDTMPIFGRQRLRGTAALQTATDQRRHKRLGHGWQIPWRASAPSAQ